MQGKPNAKKMFTVVLEFEGTTSAAQVSAANLDEALQKWLKALDGQEAYGLKGEQRAKLLAAFDIQESPVPVQGLVNVWCKTILAENQLALLHFIQTIDKPASA